MLDRIHSRKFGAAIVGAAIMLVGTSANCYLQTGSIHLTVVKAGFIVSTGSGTGTLDYQGRTYRLSVSSFGFGTIGVSGGELVGTAHNFADRGGHRRHLSGGGSRAYGRRRRTGGTVSECERCHPRIGWSTAWLSGIPRFGWDDHCLAINCIARLAAYCKPLQRPLSGAPLTPRC